MYKVDKGIPVPDRKRGNGRPAKYPLRNMLEIGDSFLVPAPGDEARIVQRRLTAIAGKLKPCRFTVRLVEGGVRVWRTA